MDYIKLLHYNVPCLYRSKKQAQEQQIQVQTKYNKIWLHRFCYNLSTYSTVLLQISYCNPLLSNIRSTKSCKNSHNIAALLLL